MTGLLEAALRYAQLDEWHVFPCQPRGKEPLTHHGVLDATTDPDRIREWWTKWPDANIGIALGASRLIAIDVDGELGPKAVEVLAAFDLPTTRQAQTGRDGGGRHAYYHVPQDTNLDTFYPAENLEVRSGRSYVIAPPSIHKSGRVYTFNNHDVETLDTDAINRIQNAHLTGATASPVGDEIPTGERNRTLASLAGTMRRRGMSESEILAALLVANAERCRPPLPDRDVAAIARSVASYQPAEQERREPSSWRRIDLVTEGATPPEPPSIGGGLFYAGMRHVIVGEPEAGKSWFAMYAAACELAAGHGVMWIDFEQGTSMTLERFRALGVSDEAITAHLAYIQPDGPLTESARAEAVALLRELDVRLVVVDATVSAFGIHGLDGDKGKDVDRFDREVVSPLRSTGAASALIDHVTKSTENRSWAIGSERKKGVCEVMFALSTKQPFGRGVTGRSVIAVKKDRLGHHPRPVLGSFVLASDATTGAARAWIDLVPDGRTRSWRPTHLMQKVSEYLEWADSHMGSVSRNVIERQVTGKAEHLRIAMNCLLDEGFAVEEVGARGSKMIGFVRPFREADTPLRPSSPPRPDLARDEVDSSVVDLVPRPPLLEGDEDDVDGIEAA